MDAVASVSLDSPHNANALSAQLVRELTDALRGLQSDERVSVVHLRSTGRVFSSGADLAEALSGDIEPTARAVINLQSLVASAPWPVVVELRGPARAGGLGLVAAADIVIAAESVSFQLTEARFGLAPAVISVPLKARVSPRVLADMALSGRSLSAIEAQQVGLVTVAVPDDSVDEAVRTAIDNLLKANQQGLRETKRLLNEELVASLHQRGAHLARRSARLFSSDVARQEMASFLARRAAES